MRSLLVLAFAASFFVWVGCLVDLSAPGAESNTSAQQAIRHGVGDAWRRTPDGWELRTQWNLGPRQHAAPRASQIHPGLIAALQVLASLGGLVAFAELRGSDGRKQ